MQNQAFNQNLAGQPNLAKQTTTTSTLQQQPLAGVAGVAAGGPLLQQNTVVKYVLSPPEEILCVHAPCIPLSLSLSLVDSL